MSWHADQDRETDKLLYRGSLAKIGRFRCTPDHPGFQRTPCIDNDVLVLPRNSLWVSRNDSEYFYVEPGSVLLHGAGSEIVRRPAGQKGDDAIWFGIHPDVFSETLERFSWSRESLGTSSMLSSALYLELCVVSAAVQSGECDAMALDEKIVSTFLSICESRAATGGWGLRPGAGTSKRHARLVENTRTYIDERLGARLDLDVIASAVGSSPFHLCRVFRKVTGTSLHDYRTQRRLAFVLDRLMSARAVDLTDLSLAAGFSSHSHMSRVFASRFGCSPSSIRSAGKMKLQ
jgi:AraC-like DNA-binding protein